MCIFSGHVSDVAFSLDGSQLASSAGFHDHMVRLWDVRSGENTAVLEGHGAWVSNVEFLPDGKTLLSTGADRTVILWDLETEKERSRRSGSMDEIKGLSLAPDRSTFATGSKDGQVLVWSTAPSPRPWSRRTLPVKAGGIAFLGHRLVTVLGDGSVAAWNLDERKIEREYHQLGTGNRRVVVSSDGGVLVAGDRKGLLKVLELAAGGRFREVRGSAVGLSPLELFDSDDRVLTVDSERTVTVWNLDTLTAERSFKILAEVPYPELGNIDYLPAQRLLATGTDTGFVHLWDVQSGK